jgi:pyruvate ferredoxin oxidoreductase gamma subunit
MAETVEIRWYGRGGQGTVTAAKVLADSCLGGGRYVQAFPEYGPERAGAPLRAYNRISSTKLRMHCPVLEPDIVAVADATLLDSINVAEGTKDNTIFLLTLRPKRSGKAASRTKPESFLFNATKIAIECFGRAMPNSPMLGAVCKITGLITLDHLLDDVRNSFGKKFSQKIIDGNLEATKRGYEEVKAG